MAAATLKKRKKWLKKVFFAYNFGVGYLGNPKDVQNVRTDDPDKIRIEHPL